MHSDAPLTPRITPRTASYLWERVAFIIVGAGLGISSFAFLEGEVWPFLIVLVVLVAARSKLYARISVTVRRKEAITLFLVTWFVFGNLIIWGDWLSARPVMMSQRETISVLDSIRLHESLCKSAKEQHDIPIKFAELTKFSWDKLYIFPPYSSVEQISADLGSDWPGAASSGIDESDGINLLVFTKGKSVVKSIALRRDCGDYADLYRPGGYSPEEAVFIPKLENKGGPWVVMRTK